MLNIKTKTLASVLVTTTTLAGVVMSLTPAKATVLTTGCSSSISCTLQELINGGTIQVGDKLFSQWGLGTGVNGSTSPAPVNVIPANIVVNGINDNPPYEALPGPGLMYSFLNNELSLNAPGIEQIFFNYRVDVTDPSYWIKDNSLSFEATITGANSKAEAHEFVFEDANRTIPALGNDPVRNDPSTNEKDVFIENDPTNPNPGSRFFDKIDFNKQYKTLFISKEFSVDVSGATGTASITNVKQNFSQQTPEASSIVGMLAISGLGFGMMRKQSKK